MDLETLSTPGLGNHAYLLASGGEALVIDPPRDAWRIMAAAEARGWRLRHALETHVHNDYLSGALELRAGNGVGIVAPAAGGYAFDPMGAREGTTLELGELRVVARSTPGHTPEHLAWEVQDPTGRPIAIFTGGSLLMGGVGRTDLLGPARSAELTDAQYRTVQRLAELPDDVRVHPTHGAGSFCVAGPGGGDASATIGELRRSNPAFGARDAGEFERLLVAGRIRYPAYYAEMAPRNRRGPALTGGAPRPRPLTPDEVAAAQSTGTWVVDGRGGAAFAAGHVPGSLNVELGDSFASYVGWLVPFDAPIALVVERPADAIEAATELLRIGYDHVLGFLAGGVEAWRHSGREASGYPIVTLRSVLRERHGDQPPALLDVRQASEWAADGVLPGSRLIFVADLPAGIPTLERHREWTVVCRSGMRAAIAASLLDAAGVDVRLVASGGVPSAPPGELVAP